MFGVTNHRGNAAPLGTSLKSQKRHVDVVRGVFDEVRKSNWQPSTKNRFKLASTRSTFSGAGTWTGNNRFACQTGLCSAPARIVAQRWIVAKLAASGPSIRSARLSVEIVYLNLSARPQRNERFLRPECRHC